MVQHRSVRTNFYEKSSLLLESWHFEAGSFCQNYMCNLCVLRLLYQLQLKIAKQVADQLNLKWELISPASPHGSELLTLLKMKSGMNSLEMSFTVNFLEKIKAIYGPDTIYFTSDGGDRIKPHLKTSRNLSNINDLVNYIIERNHLFTLEGVSVLTEITAEDIFEEIAAGPLAWGKNETIRRAIEIKDGIVNNQKILSFQKRDNQYPYRHI